MAIKIDGSNLSIDIRYSYLYGSEKSRFGLVARQDKNTILNINTNGSLARMMWKDYTTSEGLEPMIRHATHAFLLGYQVSKCQ